MFNSWQYARRACLSLALLGATAALPAQDAPTGPRTIPVRVVVPVSSTPGRAITVTRRPGEGYTIVLARDGATTENLFAAAALIRGMLDEDGPDVRDGAMYSTPPAARAPRREAAAGRRALARLSASDVVDVPGVGRARTTLIYLPRAAAPARAGRAPDGRAPRS